jgi:hypothetical protein
VEREFPVPGKRFNWRTFWSVLNCWSSSGIKGRSQNGLESTENRRSVRRNGNQHVHVRDPQVSRAARTARQSRAPSAMAGLSCCRYLPRGGPTTQGVRASIVTRTATNRMADMVRRKASFIFAIFALPSKPAPIIRRCAGTLAQRSCRYRDPAHLQRPNPRSSPQGFCEPVRRLRSAAFARTKRRSGSQNPQARIRLRPIME